MGRPTKTHGFASAYLRAGVAELGADISNPKFLLTATAVLAGDGNGKAIQAFIGEFSPRWSTREEESLRLFRELNAVWLVTYSQLGVPIKDAASPRPSPARSVGSRRARTTRARTFLPERLPTMSSMQCGASRS